MKREKLMRLGPDLILGLGIVAATWLSVHGGKSGVAALTGTLAMAVAIMGADAWRRQQGGESLRPGWAGTLLVAGLALASMILLSDDRRAMTALIPMAGMGAWVVLSGRPNGRMRCAVTAESRVGR